jgi:hypothetical protein
MLTINKGSVENIVVGLEDILGTVADIEPFNPQYGYGPEFTSINTDEACIPGPTPMSVFCLVDTTNIDPGRYTLFVQLDNPPEHPRVGPVRFKVE